MMRVPGPSPELNDEGIPIVYERALQVYDYMLANLDGAMYEDTYQLYKGKITEELEYEFGMTPSQYSRAMKLLKDANAVERIDRSSQGSNWILYYRPTVEQLANIREEHYNSRRKVSKQEIINQRLHDLALVVANLETRLAILERRDEHGTD